MKELLAAQEQLHANTVSCIMTAMGPLLAISTAQLSNNQQARVQQQQQQQGAGEDDEEDA